MNASHDPESEEPAPQTKRYCMLMLLPMQPEPPLRFNPLMIWVCLDLADQSMQTVRQARMSEDSDAFRAPPKNWKAAIIKLAEARVSYYRRLMEKLKTTNSKAHVPPTNVHMSLAAVIAFATPMHYAKRDATVSRPGENNDPRCCFLEKGEKVAIRDNYDSKTNSQATYEHKCYD
jgi:hypothetical protein